ncbi:hypothetical protein BDU57DRAFT_338251, partial [Ampelomyces quisqualis]
LTAWRLPPSPTALGGAPDWPAPSPTPAGRRRCHHHPLRRGWTARQRAGSGCSAVSCDPASSQASRSFSHHIAPACNKVPRPAHATVTAAAEQPARV